MKIEIRKITEVKPYSRNPRNNAAAVAQIAASIKEFGCRLRSVVDTKG